MAFQFNQLDKIADFDKAMAILEEEYIPNLLEAFVNSPEAKAYVKAHPQEGEYLGDWVGNFVYFGYAYTGTTLPKMKQQDAEEILLDVFPRKVSLMNPDDANSTIPELIAFWQFVQREYKQRNSKKILAFLHKIEPTFTDTMNDPSKFGMAKSFMMSGMQAGFDMTTQAGLDAFQQQYNQQLQEGGAPLPGFPGSSMPMAAGAGQNPLAAYPIPEGVPPEFVALLSQQMGFGAFPGLEHLPSDPQQLAEAIAHHLVESGDVQLDQSAVADALPHLLQELQSAAVQDPFATDPIELPESAIALLQDLDITETTPGTIVKDFETLLAAMGDKGLPVSGKLQHISLKLLGDLNAQMSQPIQLALKRPQQKSYANLHGLCLLLRATGITKVATVGKTPHLQVDPDIYASWQTLNPTEKYFTLLEAWLMRATGEMIGEDRNPMNEGGRVLNGWAYLMDRQKTYKNYNEQQDLNYWPGLHNVALMQMFGWVEINSPKPEAGKGWRIKKVKPLPIGDAIATAAAGVYYQREYGGGFQQNYTQPWGELQPCFQPYFPAWQHNLAAPKQQEHQTGTFIFKVSLDNIWRRLSISSESTLEELSYLILHSVDFDSDHLHLFAYKDGMGRTIEVHHPYDEWHNGPLSDQILVGDLPLEPGMSMDYVFDFGDYWEFSILLEEIQSGKPKRNSDKILESHGEAPEQYPSWDE
ncbi:MAG: IS1096 element passenger TnpR family protein [Thainema sp.]